MVGLFVHLVTRARSTLAHVRRNFAEYGMFDFLEGHTCQRENRVSDTNQKTEWRLSRPMLARPGPSIAVSWQHEFGVKLPAILSFVSCMLCMVVLGVTIFCVLVCCE